MIYKKQLKISQNIKDHKSVLREKDDQIRRRFKNRICWGISSK